MVFFFFLLLSVSIYCKLLSCPQPNTCHHPLSPPPSRPTQASKSNSDSLKANIAKERYTSSPDTLKMKQKARTVAIPGLPTNLAYPPKIKANGPGKPKSSSSKKKPSPSRKKGSPLDSIDKLDITGMYGQGSFHHDGPFDACRPHRNKRTSRGRPWLRSP